MGELESLGMDFLTHWKLDVPKRLAASFRKVRAAIERGDFATVHASSGARAWTRTRPSASSPSPEARWNSRPSPFVTRILSGQSSTCSTSRSRSTIRQAELFRLPLPMVLVGCAGSGKTALTLTKLRELAGEILYVTQSAYLAESVAGLYFAHGYDNAAQNVDFSSYRALLESIEVPRGRPVRQGQGRQVARGVQVLRQRAVRGAHARRRHRVSGGERRHSSSARLLGVVCGEDVTSVSAQASSVEDWQKEARRLDLQGKQEQADAIRKNILRVAPVPWPVLDRGGFRQAHERAFAPASVYNKAKQHVFEFAAFHELVTLCVALQSKAAHQPARPREATAAVARERALGPYLKGDTRQALADVGRYGLEHRDMMGLTPLMMATHVGDLALAQTLVERGARIEAIDPLGRMPIHFALRRAFHDPDFARDKLGAFYELLCPHGHRARSRWTPAAPGP